MLCYRRVLIEHILSSDDEICIRVKKRMSSKRKSSGEVDASNDDEDMLLKAKWKLIDSYDAVDFAFSKIQTRIREFDDDFKRSRRRACVNLERIYRQVDDFSDDFSGFLDDAKALMACYHDGLQQACLQPEGGGDNGAECMSGPEGVTAEAERDGVTMEEAAEVPSNLSSDCRTAIDTDEVHETIPDKSVDGHMFVHPIVADTCVGNGDQFLDSEQDQFLGDPTAGKE